MAASPGKFTKRDRARLRQLAGEAWEAELERELEVLFEHFGTWAEKGLNAFELSDLIHDFHKGVSRELYARYNTLPPTMTVARAVALGILGEGDIEPELLQKLSSEMEIYR